MSADGPFDRGRGDAAPGDVFRDRLAATPDDARFGPELAVIPAGRFRMGALKRDSDSSDAERPRTPVAFDRPFALSRAAITFAEFDAFTDATGAPRAEDAGWGRGRSPAIHVSWEDAAAYCAWLSALTGAPYRLPSEAEWEYAARTGGDDRYPTGSSITATDANFAAHAASVGRTTPVGAYAPNAWGLFDMAGNVGEWCADDWSDDHRGASRRGRARLGGAISAVVRGGGWSAARRFVRCTDRWHYARDARFEMIGFRIARDL